MPASRRKQTLRATNFSGGINNASNPRNIKDEELFWAGGFNTNEKGRIVPGGSDVAMDSSGIDTMDDDDFALGANQIDIARGYHTFSSDYNNLYTATSATYGPTAAAASSPTVPRNYSLITTKGTATGGEKETTIVECVADSSNSLDQKWFVIGGNDTDDVTLVWIDTNGSGTAPVTFTDATCDTNTTAGSSDTFGNNPRVVQMDSNTLVQVGMYVSGTGITGTATVVELIASNRFKISEDAGSSQTDTTLTFGYNDNGAGAAHVVDTIKVTTSTNATANQVAIDVANAIGDDALWSTAVNGHQVIIEDATVGIRANASAENSGFTITTSIQGAASSSAVRSKLFVHEHGKSAPSWNPTGKDLLWTTGVKPFYYHIGDSLRIANAAGKGDRHWFLGYEYTNWRASVSTVTNYTNVNSWLLSECSFASPTAYDYVKVAEVQATAESTTDPNMTGATPAYANANNESAAIQGTAVNVFNLSTYGFGGKHFDQLIRSTNNGECWILLSDVSAPIAGLAALDGTWSTGQASPHDLSGYRFYVSWVYNNDQEGTPTRINDVGNNSLGFGADDVVGVDSDLNPIGIDFIMAFIINWNAGSIPDARIKGFNLYYDKVPGGERHLYLFSKQSIEKGVKKSGSEVWYDWSTGDDTGGASGSGDELDILRFGSNWVRSAHVDPPITETFYSENGYKPTVEIDATFKTAYNANGRTYIGNIKQGGRIYPDRMIKSPRLRPDIFPEDNFMTLEANDGDEIIHLTGFGDRVFIFKKRKLYIMNIAKEREFIEQEIPGGIKGPWQVCSAEVGLAWINSEGLWVFDGKKVANVAINKISIDGGGFGKGTAEDINTTANQKVYWSEFVKDDYAMIGYDPQSMKLCIMRSADETNAYNTDCYFYSFKSKGFSFISQAWTDARDYVNFVTDPNRNLCTAYCVNASGTLQFKAWNDIPLQVENVNNNYILTKDFTFKNEGAKKIVYSVKVQYKSSDAADSASVSNLNVSYAVNGTGTFTEFATGTNYVNGGSGLAAAATYTTADLKTGNTDLVDIYSLQLKFDPSGTVPAGFEISDISIIYREKRAV